MPRLRLPPGRHTYAVRDEGEAEAPSRKRSLTKEEWEAKEARRERGLQLSTFCLQSMAWILLTFYATDYLPPLSIRLTIGLQAPRNDQYLVGYLVLGLLCLLIAIGFGAFYRPRIARSTYSWRWFLFPTVVALFLIPAQGENELLTRAVEAACLLVGIGLGELTSGWFRRSRRPAEQGRAAGS
jgi:hypothetical protein